MQAKTSYDTLFDSVYDHRVTSARADELTGMNRKITNGRQQ